MKTIIWDFDGVIADTFEQVYAVSRLAYPDLTPDEYRSRFEGNINKTFLKKKAVRDIDFFLEFEKTIFQASLTPGIAEVISGLSNTYTNVIVSSTTTPLIDRYLRQCNIRQYFAEIMGNDVAHSKVEKFKMAFDVHSTSNKSSVFITDTLGDILEAHEVGMPTIGVTWGYQSRETLLKGKPVAVIDNAEEIVVRVKEILE